MRNPGTFEPLDPCPHCGKRPGPHGEDGCLGLLPGVIAACCGHGTEEGYIIFENGVQIEFTLSRLPVRATPSLPLKL